MIPESLRKQNRAIYLAIQKYVIGKKLSPELEAELGVLEKEAEENTKRHIARAHEQSRELEANRQKTKNIGKGIYYSSFAQTT